MMRIPVSLSLLLVCLALTGPASAADVFKCTINGQTQYQDTPCEGSVPSIRLQAAAQSTLLGCYATPIKGMEEGFVVRHGKDSPYELFVTEGKNSQALPLKIATRQEMQQITAAFGIDVAEGLSMNWPPDTPNQKPVGLYKGRDRAGKEVVFVYFFFDGGFATKHPCK